MNLTEVTTLAHTLMAEHGITEKGWTFGFDNAKKRMGVCRHHTKSIGVSRLYAVEASEDEIRDTILHEIAHALAGPNEGHQIRWKVIASRIGATPKACGPNPYASRVRAEATAHAKGAARSLPAGSTTPVTTRASIGDRVVICGPYRRPVPGTVMVVTDVRRSRYLLHDERTGRDFAIPFEGARLHIEGEPLDKTTPYPNGASQREAYVPKTKLSSGPNELLRKGERGVILRGQFRGVEFTIDKKNPTTYAGILRGTAYRIPHNMVGRAA